MNQLRGTNLLDPRLAAAAGLEALRKLNPVTLFRNPIIFVTEVVAFALCALSSVTVHVMVAVPVGAPADEYVAEVPLPLTVPAEAA